MTPFTQRRSPRGLSGTIRRRSPRLAGRNRSTGDTRSSPTENRDLLRSTPGNTPVPNQTHHAVECGQEKLGTENSPIQPHNALAGNLQSSASITTVADVDPNSGKHKTIRKGGCGAGIPSSCSWHRIDEYDGNDRKHMRIECGKRRRSSSDVQERIEQLVEALRRLTKLLLEILSSSVAPINENSASKSWSRALENRRIENSMFDIVESARLAMHRARKTESPEFIQIAEMRYRRALQDYKEMTKNRD